MRLAVLTPDRADPTFADLWPARFEAYRRLFAGFGVEAVDAPWTAPPPADVDAAVPMLAWGYHLDEPAWRARLDAWPTALPLLNPPAVLLWNTRKSYLAELEAAGAPVAPTRLVDRADPAAAAEAFEAFGVDELVIKPQVSGGGYNTVRVRRGEPAPAVLAAGLARAMIQPFFEAVSDEGELSLFYFGGRLAHAVRKVAATGEFRVQQQYGGRFTLFQPDAEATAAAQAVLAAAPAALTYARVDLIRRPDGRLALMELEAIEPDLYLDLAPDGGRAFAEAVLAGLARPAV